MEELASASPPFVMTTRWDAFVALLGALDGERFRPPAAGAAQRADPLLRATREFVESTLPQEARV